MKFFLVTYLILNGLLGAESHTEMKSNDKSEVSSLTSSGKISNLLRDVLNQESLVRFSMAQRIQSLFMDALDNKNNSLVLNRKLNDINTEVQSIEAENQMMKEGYTQLKQELNTVKQEMKAFIMRQFRILKRTEIRVLQNESSKFKQELSNLKMASSNKKQQNVQSLNNISESLNKINADFMQQFQMINGSLQEHGSHLQNISTQLSPVNLKLMGKSCTELLQSDPDLKGKDGEYSINVDNQEKKVYCDMTTDGGGWTVIQKREDGSTNFLRNWADYKKGFGDPSKNYWIGNDAIHTLTVRDQELRVDLQSFDNQTAYALYSEFKVGTESTKYRLTVGGYSGTAGDSLKGGKFMTWDNRKSRHSNCASGNQGAWWCESSSGANLNGLYAGSALSGSEYIVWLHWKSWKALKWTKMMIRPKS